MKYFTLVWAGLWRKKARTLLTFFSIVTAFFLFGMLQGINLGIDSLTNRFMDTARLRVSNRVNRAGVMPLAHVARIAGVPGVVSVTPLTAVVGTYQQPTNIMVGLAVNIEDWFKIYPEFKVPPDQVAETLRTPNAALVGVATAEKYHLKIGDHIPIKSFNVKNADGSGNWDFVVTGIYDIQNAHEFATNPLLNFSYVNEARSSQKNTAMQITLRTTDPKKFAAVATAIDELFANSPDQTMTQNEKDFIQSTMAQVGNINYFVNGIVGAVLFTLLFLTANTMMQSVRERIPEIGVLKTLGFSNGAMLTFVLVEAMILSIVSAGVGLLVADGVFPVMMKTLGPTVGLEGLRVPWVVFGWGALLAVLLAFAAGFPPAWRAGKLKIVDALTGR